MSDPPDTFAEEAADLIAAEYVLGVLDADERRAAARRIADDAAFMREVQRWEAILAPLADAAPAVAPRPGLWNRIEGAVRESPAAGPGAAEMIDFGLRRSVRLWRAAAASAGAIAAVLLCALLFGRPTLSPRPVHFAQAPISSSNPLLVARLQAKGGGASFVASLDGSARELVITPATVRPITDRSPELWLIPDGGKPIPLGLGSFSRPIRLDAIAAVGSAGRTTLAVSIEPLGGSPTGQPTGPVVATGVLTRL